MGLTIHWDLKFKGSDEEAFNKMEKVREQLLSILEGFKFIDKVKFFNPTLDYNKVKDEGLSWSLIQCGKTMYEVNGKLQSNYPKERDGMGLKMITLSPSKTILLNLWAGEGCEPTNLSLNIYPGMKENIWISNSFTKTQYAKDFVKCHLLVIHALDVCKEVGILKSVYDEGNFWKTRDLKVLAKEINLSTSFIKAISDSLKKGLDGKSGLKIKSEIDDSQNYMEVK